MAMKELRFSLDFNSPAFLSSTPKGTQAVQFWRQNVLESEQSPYYPADPRGIRVPSLRGVLEFWHRALSGASSPQETFQEQARIFGSADGGQGLTIRPAGMPRFKSEELCFERDYSPYLYLGYGPLQLLRLPDRRQVVTSYHAKQARDAVCPDPSQRSRFRFVARGTPTQIDAIRRALTLLHLFGGLGSRSRRGWGSVEVEAKEEGITAPPADSNPAEWITQTLASIWNQGMYPASKGDPEFSALSRGIQIRVTRAIDGDYTKVLTELYRRFQAVRSYETGSVGVTDHTLETKDLKLPSNQSITAVPARLAFGMPYQPGHGWSMKYLGRVPGSGWKKDKVVTRRASPLLLKVIRLGPQKHAGVALFLPARFFGDSRLEIGEETKNLTRPFPGYGAIDTFLSGSGWTQVPLP